MNTKQNAEAWLSFLNKITPTKHEQLGAEIITALLKENRALLEHLEEVLSWDTTCPKRYLVSARNTIALCEENQDEQ